MQVTQQLVAVIRFKVDPARIDEFVEQYEEVVPPALAQYEDDYCGSQLGINPETGAAIHWSCWIKCPRLPGAKEFAEGLASQLGVQEIEYEWYEQRAEHAG